MNLQCREMTSQVVTDARANPLKKVFGRKKRQVLEYKYIYSIFNLSNCTIPSSSPQKVCQSLGWQGKGTAFDVLPLVLSGPDGQPKYFELPEDIALLVDLEHPK